MDHVFVRVFEFLFNHSGEFVFAVLIKGDLIVSIFSRVNQIQSLRLSICFPEFRVFSCLESFV